MLRVEFLLAIAASAGLGATTPAASPEARGDIRFVRSIDSIREYTKPKSFLARLGEWVAGPPENPPRLVRPYGLTHDSLGRLIVADPGERAVHIFDPEKRKYQIIRAQKRAPLASPIGVAVDGADNIYVTDSLRARIYVFTNKGKFLREIGGANDPTTLLRPTGIAIDAAHARIYLTDTLRQQVLVLGLDGRMQQAIGRRGTGPAEFNYPTALTLAQGALYVVDAMNFRIQAFTPEGKFLRSFGRLGNRAGTLNRPKGIAADSDGHLYVVDALFETVQIFDPEGRLLYYFGSSGAGPGELSLPAGIYIDPRNRIYVADSFNRRVQVFRYRRETP